MVVLIVTTGRFGLDKYSQELAKRINVRTISTDRYSFSRDTRHFLKKVRASEDIVHLPNQHFARYATSLKKRPIVTVHDVARLCFEFDEESTREKSLLKLDVRGIKRAAHIIAVSQNTKHDLVRYLKVPEDKVSVVYNGVDHNIFKPCPKKPIDEPYILYVGSERPRKNLPRLLQAFSKIRADFPSLKLLKVGSPGRSYEFRKQTLREVESLRIGDDVTFVDHIPEDDLPYYYSCASLLAYPSLYEGFGLPPLEAMACGCPVVTSNISSLPEVVGDAASMIDPYSVDALAKAMAEILVNVRLRGEMVERGLTRAKRFSWERTAEETLKVYERVEAFDGLGAIL
jgi:glycosyltransferase involved in cell wall biosynthesis